MAVDKVKKNGDPTSNVLSLVEAAVRRIDDMRVAETRRTDDLREAESRRIDQQADLRAMYHEKLAVAESGRIDAIRQVDVLASHTNASSVAAAVSALAATTATNAETLRNALNSTATTIAKQTSDTVSQITERIAALEKSSYTGEGRQRVADPIMAEFMLDMKGLLKAQASGSGKSEGSTAMWGYVVGAFGLVLTLVGIASAIYAVLRV